MNHHTNEDRNGPSKDVIYGGFAVLFILFIGVAAYSIVQLNSLSQRIDASSNVAQLSSQVAQLNARLTVLEQVLTPPPVELIYLYDSNDAFTPNALSDLQTRQASLEAQGFTIRTIDVKGNTSAIRSQGFQSLPVFFASEGEVAKNSRLEEALRTSAPRVTGGYSIDAYGLITEAKTSFTIACTSVGKASLFEYIDYTCPSCAQPDAALDQVLSEMGSNLTLQRKPLSFDAIRPLSSKTAEAVSCAAEQGKLDEYRKAVFARQGNLSVSALKEIASNLSMNVSDFGGCLDGGVKSLFVSSSRVEAEISYGLRGANAILADTPTIVVDCKYVFPARNASQITENICRARPDACGSRAGTNATQG